MDDARGAVTFRIGDESRKVEAGGWVDVWVLGAGEQPATLVARSCPVLQVEAADQTATALVAIPESAIGAAAEGLALGRVLLAHAPPPD